jgi:acetylornithine deacetylase/succinyl-diaminopimelate desuccinylase-like protein
MVVDLFTRCLSDYIFARGITDMKGQMLVALDAFESISATGNLPSTLFLFEGEEEIGSPNLFLS